MGTRRRPLPRSFWYSVGIAVLFNSLFLALVLIKPGTKHQFVVADDMGQALGWLLATLFCFVGFEKLRQGRHTRSNTIPSIPMAQQWVPILLALGIFCQFIGQVIYTYYDMHGWPPFPSWADAGYLSTFPFLLLGILLLPSRPLSGATRSRLLLDGFIIMTAVVTFSWYFILGPTMLQGYESSFAEVVGSTYPFFDLVLIYFMLLLWFRSSDPLLQPTVRLLLLGLTIVVITDSIYAYLTLQNIYANGLQDVGWPVGYMLIGLAAQCISLARDQQNILSRTVPVEGEPASQDAAFDAPLGKHSFLPYAFIPAVIVLSAYTWRTGGNGVLVQGVYLGGMVLIGLLLLRQFFAIRETTFYNKELRSTQEELHHKNQALSAANKRLEEQAAQVAAAYEQQVRLNELKDQFLLNVNHELRTPLTAIYGYLELLREYHGQLDTTMQTNLLNQAVHGCEELQHLVNNVLDTIRGDIAEKAPVFDFFSVAAIASGVIDLFEPQKRLDYTIRLDIPDTLTVRADKQYVQRILLNLLSNAFKYSPKHSPVIIRAQLRDFFDAQGDHESQVCICVQDAGLGIPPSEIPLLFGKFVRLKRDLVGSVRGTGLGLYINKQLVEAMGGSIWVESSGIAGQGSRFYFTLHSAPLIAINEAWKVPMAQDMVVPLVNTNLVPIGEQEAIVRSNESA
ncbi:MAG TPA: hypothetical protein DEV72_06515 [Ktedonobacter sp.]|nr:hypothetical protein [Ktedonobacter sp.]HCF84835.1 hypothetical protein [Ktedonobacter sp.]HCP73523.1 hypothetical protein [Ktedonobacter sp.]